MIQKFRLIASQNSILLYFDSIFNCNKSIDIFNFDLSLIYLFDINHKSRSIDYALIMKIISNEFIYNNSKN